MKRLTVHLSGVKARMQERKNKEGVMVKVPVIKNTLAFKITSEDEIPSILDRVREESGVKITKYYTSNIV